VINVGLTIPKVFLDESVAYPWEWLRNSLASKVGLDGPASRVGSAACGARRAVVPYILRPANEKMP
jgi:hypothetical protein